MNGIATPTQGYSAEQHWRAFLRETGQAQDQAEDIDRARQLLARGAVEGLPGAVVTAAAAAAEAERSARQALHARDAEARQQAAQMGLAGEQAQYHINTHRAGAWRAHEEAAQRATRALTELGRIAAQIETARATLAQADVRRAAIARETAQRLAEVERDAAQARAELAYLGLDR